MYNLVARLHVLECEDCGEIITVDDETLISMLYEGQINKLEDEFDDFEDCECSECCKVN